LAFELLEEMKNKHHIVPNPLTYSALIDVCGRCRRSDLALKALRLMLRDEKMNKRLKERQEKNKNISNGSNSDSSDSEELQTIGAWTAAIDACGKTGRIDTALKLFFVSMPRFNVKPNVITCSSLLDSLLKEGKTADSLEVLRYMKNHNLRPSQHTYTSLMTYASRLARTESDQPKQYNWNKDSREQEHNRDRNIEDSEGIDSNSNRPWPSLSDSSDDTPGSSNSNEVSRESESISGDSVKAVDIYSEIMSILLATTEKAPRPTPQRRDSAVSTIPTTNNELYQVTMIFREMKASGVVPDLEAYNTLLRSCSNSGDIDRAQEILRELMEDSSNDLEPNDRTWRAVLSTAGKAKRSDIVLQTWRLAVSEMGGRKESDGGMDKKMKHHSSKKSKSNKRRVKNFSLQTFQIYLTALLICAWDLRNSDIHTSAELYKIIIHCYKDLRSSEGHTIAAQQQQDLYMGMHLVDATKALVNKQILASVLQAIVNLESTLDSSDDMKDEVKELGVSIINSNYIATNTAREKKIFDIARRWGSTPTKPQ